MYVEGTPNSHRPEVSIPPRMFPKGPERSASARAAGESAPQGATSATPEASTSAAGSGEAAPAPAPTTDDGSRGVIRLLQEGHFRGVADVRLRINFAEELQGIQAESTRAALDEGLPALQEELNGAIDAFAAGEELTEEQASALQAAQEALNGQFGDLLAGDGETALSSSDVFAQLRTAFQDFLNALLPPQEDAENGTAPAVGEQVTGATGPASDTGEGPAVEAAPAALESGALQDGTESGAEAGVDVFAGLRETLTGLFEEAVSGLESTVEGLALPPLSEPNGNGAAYEKFLAVYNDLYGISGTGGDAEASGTEGGLDTSS